MAVDLVSRKNFMLLGLSAATAGVLQACSAPDAGPPEGSGGNSGGGTSKGGSTGSGGASSGGASTGGASAGGTSGGATSGGATSGGATSGGATSGGATSGGTGGSPGAGGAGGMCLAVTIEISCNHEEDAAPHMLMIPVADVMAGTAKPYTLSNNGTHDHPIMLSAEHFTTLQNGGTVHIFAESDFQSHCVTITCGVATAPTAAECGGNSLSCG